MIHSVTLLRFRIRIILRLRILLHKLRLTLNVVPDPGLFVIDKLEVYSLK